MMNARCKDNLVVDEIAVAEKRIFRLPFHNAEINLTGNQCPFDIFGIANGQRNPDIVRLGMIETGEIFNYDATLRRFVKIE